MNPNDEWRPVKLFINPAHALWEKVNERVEQLCSDIAEGFLLTQSFETLDFQHLPKNLPSLADTFSGRLFNKDQEVRWLRVGDEALIWRYTEASDEEIDCESFDRRYYLWGEWDKDEPGDHGSFFVEGRMRGRREYPVVASNEHDRAYILVREYRPAKPSFEVEDLHKLVVQLNQPRLIAHRFLDVGRSGGDNA